MKLSIHERVTLLNILPQHGNIVTLRVIDELKKALGFDEEEIQRCEITISEDGKGMKWQTRNDHGKEIEIGPVAMKEIAKGFAALSDAEQMPLAYLPVYERFAAVLEGVLQ